VTETLFRPVGLEELRLMYDADMRAFPPRLPDQPIFYPVTNEGYARQIATEWNTKTASLAGFVTSFEVDDPYLVKFERRTVGAKEHEELWVPAEELAEFNSHIAGRIVVVAAYFGAAYRGSVPQSFGLKGKSAAEQLVALARTLPYSGFDVACEIAANHAAVFLNYLFWDQHDFRDHGIDDTERDRLLGAFAKVWASGSRASIPLGIAPTRP
jgi:hypothetical protein